jgi:hypothetical protein
VKGYAQANWPRRRSAARRADTHEQQAREAGRGFRRGRRDLRRGLTPTPAAGAAVAASRGEPLAGALREDLERAFGADLSAVRIHRDAAAQAAAADQGAAAFASGRDVYFARGDFDPVGEAGRELIAHEVAHVLQQTARPSGAGRPAVTDARGLGPVQCDDEPTHADDRVPFLASGGRALTTLVERHGSRADADQPLRDLIQLVQARSGGALPRRTTSAIGTTLVEIARAGLFRPAGATTPVTLTAPASGFLLDCLKVCGLEEHFEAAAALLDADTTFAIRTAFGPRAEFREFLSRAPRGEDWVAEAFRHEPLKRFWSFTFVNTVEQFVLNPWRLPQMLYGFGEARTAALENVHGEKPDLLASDRVLMAFELLDKYDARRLSWLAQIDELLAKNAQARSVARMARPLALRAHLDKVLSKPEPAFWTEMLRRLRALAITAGLFWVKVAQFQTALSDTYVKADRDELLTGFMKAERPFAEDDPLMAPLRRALASMGEPGGLFFLDAAGKASDVPTPADYEKRIAALTRTIDFRGRLKDNFLLSLQQELVRAYRRGEIDSPRALGLGWMLRWSMEFAAVLSSYSAKTDDPAYADGRLAHRSRVADDATFVAQVAHWADIRDMAARIHRGLDRDASYLAVPGQWQLEPDVPIARLQTDFPGDLPLGGYHGLRPSHLAHFFQGEFLESLAGAIEATLSQARRVPKEDLDAEALQQKVAALPRPWRCTPDRSALLVLRDEDRGASGKITNFQLIAASAKSRDELRRLSADRRLGPAWDWIAVIRPPVRTPIFAWIVPDFVPIITLLKSSEPFKSRMTDAGFQDLPETAWLEKLIDLSGATISQDILGVIDARVAGQQARFTDALRQLTALRRRLIARDLAAKLQKYKKDRSVTNYAIPATVVDTIWHFRGQVEPAEDGERQAALLVLGLGPDLEAAFPDARQAVKIPPYFHETLTATLAFVPPARQATAAGASDAQRRFVDGCSSGTTSIRLAASGSPTSSPTSRRSSTSRRTWKRPGSRCRRSGASGPATA